METTASSTEVVEKGSVAAVPTKPPLARPTLTLPPRNPAEAFLKGSDAATPSPMTFVSSLFADQDPYAGDYRSFSQLLAGAMASPTATHLMGDGLMTPSSLPSTSDNNTPAVGNSGADGGLPHRSNSARFKSMMPPRLPISRSPYLMIPPGLSPTTLLDSPILLSTGQAEPSPTTGTFFFPPLPQEAGLTGAPTSNSYKERSYGQDGSPGFVFKPHPQLPNSPLASMGPFGLSHQQALAQVQAQAQSQLSSGSSGTGTAPDFESISMVSSATIPTLNGPKIPSQSVGLLEPAAEPSMEPSEKVVSSQGLVLAHPLPHVVERPSEDGYNWRKYGQKQVKGSEYPRSYYKCTHPSCSVKKKVERSYDGQVTEIVYKGEHNHPKPQGTRRMAMSNTHSSDGLGREASHALAMERSSASIGIGKADSDRGLADPMGRGQLVPFSGGLSGTPEPSLGSISDDEVEDGGDDESDSKRRKMEKAKEVVANPPLRTIREPRVVVQTTSEVDILDDGYRWRKYGQKVVKGNPHPRSYYKCTNVGCMVRKHVERSSTDSKAVITTYEGKHNHDVPAARNSSHETSGPMAASASLPAVPSFSGPGVLGANTLAKPATSRQEQSFGRPLEDGYKMVAGIESGHGGSMHRALISEQSRGQGGTDGSSQPALSMMGSNIGGPRPLEGGEYFGQGLGLRPKEEPGDVHPLGGVLQPAYQTRLLS